MWRPLLSCVMLLGPASGQGQIWIVDAQNGTGAHFVDIPPAVAAAQHGDTILVRPGRYRGFATQKGLAVVGLGSGPGAVLIAEPVTALGASVVRVDGLPAQVRFALSNVFIRFESTQKGLELDNDAGSVFVSQVEIGWQPCFQCGGGALYPGVMVNRCARVGVAASNVNGNPGVLISDSYVIIAGCSIRGTSTVDPSHPCCAGAGIDARNSRIFVARSSVFGGAGDGWGAFYVAPRPAIILSNGEFHLQGDARDQAAAGPNNVWMGPTLPTPAISGGNARLELDPLVRLYSTDGGPTILCSCPIVSRRRVSVYARDGVLGSLLPGEVVSRPGDFFVLLLDTPRPPATTPFGELHVDPGASLRSVLLLQQPSGATAFALPVPAATPLTGVSVCLQSVGFDSLLGQPDLSNPTIVVLR